MRRKFTIEQEINNFLELWDCKQLMAFWRDCLPLFELFDVEEKDDWVQKEVGGDEENVRTIRLVRMTYLLSRICAFHAGKMCSTNVLHRDLWKRMQKQGVGQQDENEKV